MCIGEFTSASSTERKKVKNNDRAGIATYTKSNHIERVGEWEREWVNKQLALLTAYAFCSLEMKHIRKKWE